jgi:hypothetical protein
MERILITCLLVFKAAYESIDRSSLYAAMEEMNVPQKLIVLVKAKMNNTHCQVNIQNRLSALIKSVQMLVYADDVGYNWKNSLSYD